MAKWALRASIKIDETSQMIKMKREIIYTDDK